MYYFRYLLDKIWDAAYWTTRCCRECEQVGWHPQGCPNRKDY